MIEQMTLRVWARNLETCKIESQFANTRFKIAEQILLLLRMRSSDDSLAEMVSRAETLDSRMSRARIATQNALSSTPIREIGALFRRMFESAHSPDPSVCLDSLPGDS